MRQNTTDDIIVCFISLNSPRYITNFFVNPFNYEILNSTNSTYVQYTNNIDNAVKGIKSLINFDKTKSLICFYVYPESSYYLIYSIENNNFSHIEMIPFQCRGEYYNIKFSYMRETNQFLFYCVKEDSNVYLASFDDNFNYLNNYTFNDTPSLGGLSIIYSYYFSNIILFLEIIIIMG